MEKKIPGYCTQACLVRTYNAWKMAPCSKLKLSMQKGTEKTQQLKKINCIQNTPLHVYMAII